MPTKSRYKMPDYTLEVSYDEPPQDENQGPTAIGDNNYVFNSPQPGYLLRSYSQRDLTRTHTREDVAKAVALVQEYQAFFVIKLAYPPLFATWLKATNSSEAAQLNAALDVVLSWPNKAEDFKKTLVGEQSLPVIRQAASEQTYHAFFPTGCLIVGDDKPLFDFLTYEPGLVYLLNKQQVHGYFEKKWPSNFKLLIGEIANMRKNVFSLPKRVRECAAELKQLYQLEQLGDFEINQAIASLKQFENDFNMELFKQCNALEQFYLTVEIVQFCDLYEKIKLLRGIVRAISKSIPEQLKIQQRLKKPSLGLLNEFAEIELALQQRSQSLQLTSSEIDAEEEPIAFGEYLRECDHDEIDAIDAQFATEIEISEYTVEASQYQLLEKVLQGFKDSSVWFHQLTGFMNDYTARLTNFASALESQRNSASDLGANIALIKARIEGFKQLDTLNRIKTLPVLRTDLQKLIATCRQPLSKETDNKKLLYNALLLVCTLGFGYFIAGLINYALHKRFLLIPLETKALESLDSMAAMLDEPQPDGVGYVSIGAEVDEGSSQREDNVRVLSETSAQSQTQGVFTSSSANAVFEQSQQQSLLANPDVALASPHEPRSVNSLCSPGTPQ